MIDDLMQVQENRSQEEDKKEDLALELDDKVLRRNYSRKKHWPLKFSVQVPGLEAPIELEMSSATKIKSVKHIVSEKLGSELHVDLIQLAIEGGEILKKNANTLDSYGIKNGDVLVVEQVEKIIVTREKKAKEETKLSVHYKVRGSEQLASKLEVPSNIKIKQLKKLILEELGMSG